MGNSRVPLTNARWCLTHQDFECLHRPEEKEPLHCHSYDAKFAQYPYRRRCELIDRQPKPSLRDTP